MTPIRIISLFLVLTLLSFAFSLPTTATKSNDSTENMIEHSLSRESKFTRNVRQRSSATGQVAGKRPMPGSARQEDVDIEEVTPTVETDRPTYDPPARNPFWTFIRSFLDGIRMGNPQSMIGQLVQQITSLVQGVSNFFTGSNDVSFTTPTMVEREASAVHTHRRGLSPASNAGGVGRSVRAKRLATDDILSLFQTNSSQVEQQLKQGVHEIERSLDTLWSQVQNTFNRDNLNQVLKKFELNDEQLEETKEIAQELQNRVALAWKRWSKEVSSHVDQLTEQVQAVASNLGKTADNVTSLLSEASAN